MAILQIHKLADKTTGERVRRYDPDTGQPYLSDPASANPAQHTPWPLAGVRLIDAPAETAISTTKVAEGEREGWLELVDVQLAHRPGGPADNPWKITHTFRHAAELVFHTVDGDVRYRVVHQPDKYADPGDDSTPVTAEVYAAGATRVDHFYGLERVDG